MRQPMVYACWPTQIATYTIQRHQTCGYLPRCLYSLPLYQILNPSRHSSPYLSFLPTAAADGSLFLCVPQPIEPAVLSVPSPPCVERRSRLRLTCCSQPKWRQASFASFKRCFFQNPNSRIGNQIIFPLPRLPLKQSFCHTFLHIWPGDCLRIYLVL